MLTICELDAAGVFTGRSALILDEDGCPPDWVRVDVPDLPEGKAAQWVGGAWAIIDPPPPPPEPVPEDISDRQFFQQLALDGEITHDEAIEAVTVGQLPDKLASALASIPDATARFSAAITIMGATIFKRSHPLTAMLGQILGKDDAALDELWRKASKLP